MKNENGIVDVEAVETPYPGGESDRTDSDREARGSDAEASETEPKQTAKEGGSETSGTEGGTLRPFVADVKIEKSEYIKLSLYNMRRFLGVKQLLLYLLLLFAAVALFWGFRIWLFLLLFGIVNLLIIAAVGVFLGTSFAGFKYEFVKTGVVKQRITVGADGIGVENLDAEGKVVFKEFHEKQNVEKLALTKDRVFVFRSTAVYYYIRKEDVADGRFFELQDYLKASYPETVFKLRKKIKQYPGFNNKE